jgi:CheY-like chemotaxis protein
VALLRALVVDDNDDGADTLGLLLRLDGHDVTVTYDGEAALREAYARLPDVVFIDLAMPHMDGYELLRRLRQEPGCRGALLVAVSGYGREEDKRRCREAGFDYHLTKPAEQEAIRRVIATAQRST